MPHRLQLAIQFWAGDKEAAMRNALRIADNEPKFRDDVEFTFVARNDCTHDPETVAKVSQKFKTSTYTAKRRGTGWPHGCNELALDFLNNAVTRHYKAGDIKAIFLFEADCIPVAKDWIDVLHKEWEEGQKTSAQIVGCWLEYWGGPCGHINGNAIFHPLISKNLGLIGCSPEIGWDVAFAEKFSSCWHKSGMMKNLYRATNVAEADMTTPWIPGERVVLIHGVKDLSVEKYADKVLFGRV